MLSQHMRAQIIDEYNVTIPVHCVWMISKRPSSIIMAKWGSMIFSGFVCSEHKILCKKFDKSFGHTWKDSPMIFTRALEHVAVANREEFDSPENCITINRFEPGNCDAVAWFITFEWQCGSLQSHVNYSLTTKQDIKTSGFFYNLANTDCIGLSAYNVICSQLRERAFVFRLVAAVLTW